MVKFKRNRNPFLLIRSYIGAILFVFIPAPVSFYRWIPNIVLPFILVNEFFPLIFLSLLFSISGFFIFASTKKGYDNFLLYGIISLIVLAIYYLLLFHTKIII